MVVPRNPCHARQHRRTEHSYIICISPCSSQAFPLIKRSRVHCTQLCIIHQAFLSMEHVFHTRQHFKLTCKMHLPKLHPLIGHCRQFHHRQQQGHGTSDCRRIYITSWPCPKMCRSAMDAVKVLQKNFVRNHITSWLSTLTVRWYAGTTTQGRWCTAQTLPIPITIPALRISCEKTLFLTDVYISTSAPTTHLMNARRKY